MYLVHKLRSPFGGRGRSRRLDGTVALVKKVIPSMRKAYGWRNKGKMLNVVYERPSNLRG